MSLIRLRGGTEAEWTAADPVLAARECGVTTDTHRIKVGDGVTPWSSLAYADAAAATSVPLVAVDADYSVTEADYLILATGTVTVTLPTGYGLPGRSVIVKNIGSDIVTVTGVGEDIDSGAAVTLNSWEAVTLVSSGAALWVIV